MTSEASKASGSETRNLTPEQRARLVEAMARSRAARDGYDWDDIPPYRDGYLSQAKADIAAAERAGFRIEAPGDG